MSGCMHMRTCACGTEGCGLKFALENFVHA